MMRQSALQLAMIADLARSGLTGKDATTLKIKVRNEQKTKEATGVSGAISYQIPYFDINGKSLTYYRIRFLDPVPVSFEGKATRYMQPSGSIPRLYLPPIVEWKKIASDTGTTIYITEGEKKAARACKAKLPCIGLGGVWSWKSTKNGLDLIDDFKWIDWKGRKVVVVFDSDMHEKENVQKALVHLSRQLVKLGAYPHSIKLPSVLDSTNKVGLDDFLEEKSLDQFLALPESDLYGNLSKHLWSLNEELAYIQKLEGIYKFQTEQVLTKGTLTEISYANRVVPILKADGKMHDVSVAKEWLKWEHRRTHTNITYAPGQPRTTDKNELNIWKGWGLQPKKGDIKVWNELLDFIFQSEPEHKKWFLQWLAYPLQNPGAKMYSAVVFFSLAEGMGKTLVGVTMGRIYGDNFSAVTQKEIHSDYNFWAAKKQFILGDDITGSDKRQDADLLKVMVSRETVSINIKYQPQYTVPDCANYFLTTNQPDAFILSKSNRRMFILELDGNPMPEKFYKVYDTWLWSTEGPAALFYHLLNDIDCSSFNPKAHAPLTKAKSDMTELSHSDLDMWSIQLYQNPDSILQVDGKVINRVFWTTTELLALYDPLNMRKSTLIAMSKSLRRAGFSSAQVTKMEHTTVKIWAIRDPVKWKTSDHHQRAHQYMIERHKLQLVKPKKF